MIPGLTYQASGRRSEKYFGEIVFKTVIPRNVRLSEAPSYGKSIIDYDPRSKGAEVYKKLAEEVLFL